MTKSNQPRTDGPSTIYGQQLGCATTTWVAQQVVGDVVGVIGDFDARLIAALVDRGERVQLFGVNALVAEQLVQSLPKPLGDAVRIGSANLAHPNDQDLACVDTVIVRGWPDGENPAAVIERARRVGKETGRIVVALPEFASETLRERGFDLGGFLDAMRSNVVPRTMSAEQEELRFVGELGCPAEDEWRRFESAVWPALVSEMVRMIQTRHRWEMDGLRHRARVLDVSGTVSFRVGSALVETVRTPRRIWRLPGELWRVYRSIRLGRSGTRTSGRRVSIPRFDLPSHGQAKGPVIATILDTFSEHCFRYEASLLPVSPRGWREEIEASRPAFLFVESAWAGNNGAWHRLIADSWRPKANPLVDLLTYCRSREIPTVFWNKEDPPHFDSFIDAAKRFDVVLTTDAECVPKYKSICKNDRVYAMPFAAQPQLHNPRRQKTWPRHEVAFAGSWMGTGHRGRASALRYLLEPALEFDLHIFDRNLYRKDLGSRASMLRFPDHYRAAIKGSLDYAQMLTAYRCYDVHLNTNSVSTSTTMFSRRVFESLACGTPVVSTDSLGMRRLLGNHVRVTCNAEETSSHLQALLEDEGVRAREGHLAYRHVHEEHTYRHRLDYMLSLLRLDGSTKSRPSVSVVTVAHTDEQVTCAVENFRRQMYADKELVLVLSVPSIDPGAVSATVGAMSNVHVSLVENGSPSRLFNHGVDKASGEFVMSMVGTCLYGERYIADMMLATEFADADILGKGTYFRYQQETNSVVMESARPEHEYADFVVESTLAARRDLLVRLPFPAATDQSFIDEAVKQGCRIYSTDRFNHLVGLQQENGRVSIRNTIVDDGNVLTERQLRDVMI